MSKSGNALKLIIYGLYCISYKYYCIKVGLSLLYNIVYNLDIIFWLKIFIYNFLKIYPYLDKYW